MKALINKISLILLMTTIAAGCGSSGGGDSSAPNIAPVADAGHDLKALNDVVVVLDGGASSDAEGDLLTYSWSLVTKPVGSNATLSNSTSMTPVFTTDAPGTYTASLIVNDGTSSSNPDTVGITAISSISQIRDTGQNDCYNNTAKIPCPTIGEAFYGQDAQYSTNPLRFVDNGTTVSDTITGLRWQKADNGIQYNWYQAMGLSDATYNPGGVIDVCGSLNLDGFNDWRLPSRRELYSIVNISQGSIGSGSAESVYFQSTGDEYWSTTTRVGTPAWRLSGARMDAIDGGTFAFYVRCVRGTSWGQNMYFDNGDGTVTDNMSGLVWQKDDGGVARNWESALLYCENLILGGSFDWRLPDIKELESIVTITPADDTFDNPSVDAAFFPTTQNTHYWSSSASASHLSGAWNISFVGGFIQEHDLRTSFKLTRCVR